MKKIVIPLIVLLFAIKLFAIDGVVIQTSFVSQNTGKAIPFSIYLPPHYDDGTDIFPLIFHLHGIGGTHNGNQITSVPESFEKALKKGLIQKAIIVFPDGFKDAFWSDSKNSDKPAESNLIFELLPHIQSKYRISEGCIAIQGFSMGGFGASKIFSKYPNLFCSLISYDGAFLNINGMIKFHNNLWKEIFDEDSVYFKENSPWEYFRSNKESIINKPIRILKGSLGYNVDFNSHLLNMSYHRDYIETGCEHVLKCLLDSEGENSWIAISQAFSSCKATDVIDKKESNIISLNLTSEYIEIRKTSEGLELSEDSEIKIYNPFGECVMVEQTSLSVQNGHSSNGQTRTSNLLRINISHLPAGIYFIKIGNYSEKFFVMR